MTRFISLHKLHAQILSELEAMHHRGPRERDSDKERAKDGATQAKVKGVESQGEAVPPPPKAPKPPKFPSKAQPNPKPPSPGDTPAARPPCTFYASQSGCKKGADCTFEHNWNAFSGPEKSQRCKVCGSKNHKSPECKAGLKDDKDKPATKGLPKNPAPSKPPAEKAPPPTKDVNNQAIKSMLADAARILQQAMPETTDGNMSQPVPAQPVPMCPPPSQPNTVTPQTTTGTPVTLASLSAQLESLRSLAREHEIRVVTVEEEQATADLDRSATSLSTQLQAMRARMSEHEAEVSMFRVDSEEDKRLVRALALLDSGATHAVIPYSDTLGSLERVPVTLAGDERQEWLRTRGGTLVVPPPRGSSKKGERPQTILPLGSLVETLGCQVSWSRRKGLKVWHPSLGVLSTGISNSNCPVVQEDQALKLIAELESKRLEDLHEQVQNLECKMRSLSNPTNPTMAMHGLLGGADRVKTLQAIMVQPYLEGVSDDTKARLAEEFGGDDDSVGRQLLKSFPLRRAKRRALLQSRKWLVHLCAGKPTPGDPLAQWCDNQGIMPVQIDLKATGGKGWDLTKQRGVWRALLWAAASGRVVGVLSSPPRIPRQGREGLYCQDKLLWSLASVAKGAGIPYVREVVPEDVKDHVSFMKWSGVKPVTFNQGVLSGTHQRKTCLLTNLDLGFLANLHSSEVLSDHSSSQTWSSGLRSEIVKALSGRPSGPSCEELDSIIRAASSGSARMPDFDLQEEIEELRLNAMFEQESVTSTSGEEECQDPAIHDPFFDHEPVCLVEPPDVCEVKEMSSDALEGWKRHLANGHVPYRRDCRQCVEGAALGHFHKKVTHPKLYSLSVDLFGPVPVAEAGRDEGCVTGKCILRYGLVAAFRIPKSVLKLVPHNDGVEDLFQRTEVGPRSPEDDLRDIEPWLPDWAPDKEEPRDQEEQGPIMVDAVDSTIPGDSILADPRGVSKG